MANETRLIYSSDVLEEASKAEFMGFRAEERKKTFLELISAMLENCPKVAAVEVVYCKDCARCKKGFCTIRKDGWGATLKVGLLDFCSYGERKDNERKSD